LISNTDSSSVRSVLEKFDMNKYFDEIALSCDTGLLKSNKKSFSTILKKLKIKKTESIMVGDSMESDIKGAENAGIKAILVDRYNKREYENKISNLNELRDKLK
jgi:putative hydrolase of the HAD superfamily